MKDTYILCYISQCETCLKMYGGTSGGGGGGGGDLMQVGYFGIR